MSKLKGVIGVFQIIMVLKGDIEVSWPTMWSGFADSFSFLAVNPMALPLTACAWTFTFYQKFIIIMVGPIFIVCVITPTMFLITKHCKCCPRWWPEVRFFFLNVFFLLVSFFFFYSLLKYTYFFLFLLTKIEYKQTRYAVAHCGKYRSLFHLSCIQYVVSILVRCSFAIPWRMG